MSTKIDYLTIEQKYLNKVQELRNSYAPVDGLEIQHDALSSENTLFCITEERYKKYRNMLDEFERISSRMLQEIISALLKEYNKLNVIAVNEVPIYALIFVENGINKLFYFKKYGILSQFDRLIIRSLSESMAIKRMVLNEIHYVSMVKRNAASYDFNHSYDNCEMTIKEFFHMFFDDKEYIAFERMEKHFSETAKMYIGHTVVKTLSPYALYSFKRYIDSYIHGQEFASIIDESNAKGNIDKASADKINKQFFENSHYSALVGETSFSQSLITAEWMYYSLNEAVNIDLTIIALGFFKAFEQVLLNYTLLHCGENRKIKKLFPTGKDDRLIDLTDENVQRNQINTMIDSLIKFYINNKDLFCDEINGKAKNYIISVFEKIKFLRNGYLHRDNIEDKKIIDEARQTTYLALYYLLGSYRFRDDDKVSFSIPLNSKLDYLRLHEHMSFYAHRVYYIGVDGKPEFAAGALKDTGVTYDKYGNANYSKSFINVFLTVGIEKTVIPLNDFKQNKISTEWRELDFTESNLIVMEGEMRPTESGVEFTGPLRTLYKNGKYMANERMVVEDF